MTTSFNLFSPRRRKLDVEEVFNVYSEPPSKSRKTDFVCEQMEHGSMDVDHRQAVTVPDVQFPVNSFPLAGVNGWMSSHTVSAAVGTVHAVVANPRSMPISIASISMNGVSIGPDAGQDQEHSHIGMQAHMETNASQQQQQQACPDCLSGKSGHFFHIQTKHQDKHL